jgi:hypothetical protein
VLSFVWQAVTVLAQGLRSSQEAVMWCKERAARVGDRAAALVPALEELEWAVLAPGRGVEVRLVESLSIMLVLLAKVCSPRLLPPNFCSQGAPLSCNQVLLYHATTMS